MRTIIDKGADPNANIKGYDVSFAILHAIISTKICVDILLILLECGLIMRECQIIDMLNKISEFKFQHIITDKIKNVIALMFSNSNIDVNKINYYGNPLLIEHTQRNNSIIVESLLEIGADPNIMDLGCYVPLMRCRKITSMTIIRLLMRHGADPYITRYGKTCIKILRDRNIIIDMENSTITYDEKNSDPPPYDNYTSSYINEPPPYIDEPPPPYS